VLQDGRADVEFAPVFEIAGQKGIVRERARIAFAGHAPGSGCDAVAARVIQKPPPSGG
jgi:hypothetical protein